MAYRKEDIMSLDFDCRKKATELLDLVDDGVIDARKALQDVLINYMSADDANDFAETYLDEWQF